MIQTQQVAVSTVPVELTIHELGDSSIVIAAPDTAKLYVGGPNVSSTTGYPIPAGGTICLDLTGERIYGVLAAGTGTAYVLRTGV